MTDSKAVRVGVFELPGHFRIPLICFGGVWENIGKTTIMGLSLSLFSSDCLMGWDVGGVFSSEAGSSSNCPSCWSYGSSSAGFCIGGAAGVVVLLVVLMLTVPNTFGAPVGDHSLAIAFSRAGVGRMHSLTSG